MELWADLTRSTAEVAPRALAHARSAAVTTVLLRPDQLAGWEPLERIDVACRPDSADRLIEARHDDVTVNVFLQDDWHVGIKVAERISEF
jgi:hypothetical protein